MHMWMWPQKASWKRGLSAVLLASVDFRLIIIRLLNIYLYYKLKSYKLKLLGKVIQYDIRASFDGRSCIRPSHIYSFNSSNPKRGYLKESYYTIWNTLWIQIKLSINFFHVIHTYYFWIFNLRKVWNPNFKKKKKN